MILVFGTLCLDRVRRIDSLPTPGGYAGVQSEEIYLGGEAANTATALRKWGAELELAGNLLGDGEEAHLLLRKVVEMGLPTDRLKLAPGVTPVCDIYVTPDGDRTMFGLGFDSIANNVVLTELPFQAGEWFTVDMNLANVAREAVHQARFKGMHVYLMDFLHEEDPIDSDTFWQSSTDWVGVRGNTQRNVEWVRKFIEKQGCFCVLSDGPNGLVAGSPSLPVRHYPPYPAPKYVDSTGAGDIFRAGMLFGLDQDWPISKCLMYASAAGSLKCQGLGATGYVPGQAEIEQHIQANPDVTRNYQA